MHISVLPVPKEPSQPHSPKTAVILGPLTATHTKFATLQDSKAQQHLNLMLWESLRFFLFLSTFFHEKFDNLLNMTKFLSLQLMAAHGHFHSQQFLTAKMIC